MIISATYDNVNDAFVGLCKEAISWPIEVRRGGNQMMDSFGPVCIEIVDPRDRVLNVQGRNNSLPAACAETLWILAGRSDVDWLKFYLPRAPDFSDDGKVWRAGYGPRLRKLVANRQYEILLYEIYTDQLKFVVDELVAVPNSRRAIISLVDQPNDMQLAPVVFKDFPCNLTLSFMVRNNKLDLVVFCRSQDLIWGASGINWFEFTVMQELVANMIDVPIGSYYHVTNNLHVYDRHFNIVKSIVSAPYVGRNSWDVPEYKAIPSLKEMDAILKMFFAIEEDVRSGEIRSHIELSRYSFVVNYKGTLLEDLGMVALAYCAHKNNPSLESAIRTQIIDSAMLDSYDRYISWIDRPKIPRLEEEEK